MQAIKTEAQTAGTREIAEINGSRGNALTIWALEVWPVSSITQHTTLCVGREVSSVIVFVCPTAKTESLI